MLRLALSPRWLMWHVLTLGAMATCAGLAAWQWQRAGSALGSALNVGYGVQWPVFAIFFGVMWWRFLSLEARGLPATAPEPVPVRRVVVADDGPSPFTARPAATAPITADENPGLVEYNRLLRELADEPTNS